MFCSRCGRQVDDSSLVCVCGASLQTRQLAQATGAESGAATVTSAAAAPAPTSTTKACPYCGEQILAEALRCKHCQANLVPGMGPILPAAAPGAAISVQGPHIPSGSTQPTIVIQNVQAQQGPPAWTYREIKSPGVALLLSIIFPGGGQFYNGHIGKGILVLLTFWILGITYIWSWFDAYHSAKVINCRGY